jgi:hypothetical protein
MSDPLENTPVEYDYASIGMKKDDVTRSGAEPFNHRFFSDHRGIFVDLELKGLFDRNLAPLARPTFRDIRSGSSRLIQVYINELKTYLLNHKIAEQIDQLAQAQDDGLAEAIDQKITSGMLLAGSKCETAGRLPKSVILHEAQTTLRIYQNVLSQFRTKRDLSKQIEKRQLQLPVAIALPTTITETNRLLRISQRTVRKLAQKAYDLKKQQRDEKVAEHGSVKEKIFQRIERAEYTKAMFLRLLSIKSKPSGGISLVKVPTDLPDKPKEAKEWRIVTEPDEIEQLIMKRQQVHFGQASPTPFVNTPLKSTFNWTGTSPEVQVVLNGDYVPSHKVDSQSNRILQSCT